MSKEDNNIITQHCVHCKNYHRSITRCIDSGCEFWAQLMRPKKERQWQQDG